MNERLLLFTTAGPDAEQTLALPAGLGREAFVPQHLLPLPGGHAGLLGLTEVRGRTVPLLNLAPLINPSALLGPSGQPVQSAAPSLALLIEAAGEALALPVRQVLGVFTVDAPPGSADLLSEPFSAGEHTCRLLNPAALIAVVRTRLALV